MPSLSHSQVNVMFRDRPKEEPGCVEMMGEIQIHLAPTHCLKQQDHIFYEIRRSRSIEDLRPKQKK